MALRIVCPSCNVVLNAPDTAPGKPAKCPKCRRTMLIPDLTIQEGKSIDSPRHEIEEDRDVFLQLGLSRIPAFWRGAGVTLLIVVIGAGLWLAFSDSKVVEPKQEAAPVVATSPTPAARPRPEAPRKPWTKGSAPPGWSLVDGFRFACFLPGIARNSIDPRTAVPRDWYDPYGDALPATDGRSYEWWTGQIGEDRWNAYAYEFEKRTLGNTEPLLLDEYRANPRSTRFSERSHENFLHQFGKVNGLPCLKLTFQDKPMPTSPKGPSQHDKARTHYTIVLISHHMRLYVFEFIQAGKMIGEDDLKIFLDSFEER